MSDPKEILERRLHRAQRVEDNRGLHFFCQVGGNDDPLGLTTLQLNGSGWTLLSWKRGEERELYSVELAEADQKRFYGLMVENPFWEASPIRRPREDGETNVHFRLSDSAAGTYAAVQFWENDMDEYPVLADFLGYVNRLIRVISEGEVPCLALDSRRSLAAR